MDRQTDGRTHILPQHSPRYTYASCSKICYSMLQYGDGGYIWSISVNVSTYLANDIVLGARHDLHSQLTSVFLWYLWYRILCLRMKVSLFILFIHFKTFWFCLTVQQKQNLHIWHCSPSDLCILFICTSGVFPIWCKILGRIFSFATSVLHTKS